MYQEYTCTYIKIKLNDKCNIKNNTNDYQQYTAL